MARTLLAHCLACARQAIQEELNEKKRATAQTVQKIFKSDGTHTDENHGFGKHKKYDLLQKQRKKEREKASKASNSRNALMMGGLVATTAAPRR